MGNLGSFIVLLCFLVEINCVPLSGTAQSANQADGCKQNMDIAILADRSRSMSTDSRAELIKAVNVLVRELGVSETGNHFGFVTFAVNAILHNKFSNPFYYIAKNLKRKVEKEVMFEPDRDSTRTDLAMQLTETKLFTKDGGHRPNARSVLLLITDGRPVFVNKEWDKRPEVPTSRITKLLEKKNVSILIIGVGQVAKHFKNEMEVLAGNKRQVILFDSFEELTRRIVDEFKSKSCDLPLDPPTTKLPAPPAIQQSTKVPTQASRPSDPPTTKLPAPPAIQQSTKVPTQATRQSTKAPTQASKNDPILCPTDVAFILDSSNSIKDEDFYDEKEIVKKLVMDLDIAPEKNRAALVLFGSSPSLEARFGQYESFHKFQDVLEKLPKMGKRTRIDRALNFAKNQIFPGSRQDVHKMAIILTDGVQSTGAQGLRPSSKSLRDAGVRVIAVGIGAGKRERRLRLMTDRDEDVVDLKNVQGHLQEILDDLSQNGCNQPLKPPAQEKCEDESVYEHECRKKTKNKRFCWDHPDFSFIHCQKSCELCSLS